MKTGDIVRLKHITDFKGIVLRLTEHTYDELGENEIKMWKVLWFNHPHDKKGPLVAEYPERGLVKA